MKNIKQQKIREQIMVNPNSLKNVKEILDEYKVLHGIGNNRQWMALGCNGPPFVVANKIVEEEPEK